MREQARMANVQPATMTRLAQWLGFSGFDELRALYADALHNDAGTFSSRSVKLLERRESKGDIGLISDYVDVTLAYIENLKSPALTEAIVAASNCLRSASTIYAAGARSAFPFAFQFAYVSSYFSEHVILLDGPGGIGADRLKHAGSSDALIVTSVEPYATQTVSLVQEAKSQGVSIVAVTDSAMSPVGRMATVAIPVQKISPSFFDTIAPAFVVGEILVALLAAHQGKKGTEKIELTETRLRAAGEFSNE